jgi:hypothetical protein
MRFEPTFSTFKKTYTAQKKPYERKILIGEALSTLRWKMQNRPMPVMGQFTRHSF